MFWFLFVSLKCFFKTLPVLYFQHPNHPGRRRSHSNPDLPVQHKCLSVSASVSSQFAEDRQIKNEGSTIPSLNANKLQGYFSYCFFQDTIQHSVISGQSGNWQHLPLSFFKDTTKTFYLISYHITPSARWILFLMLQTCHHCGFIREVHCDYTGRLFTSYKWSSWFV